MCSENLIEVKSVSKTYEIYKKPEDRLKKLAFSFLQKIAKLPGREFSQNFRALNSISFSVARGETIGVIGLNGSGKSTLLKVICGTLAQTSGEVVVNGRVAALLELGTGFDPEFTGRENIFLNASILGLTRSEIEEKYESIVQFADIGEFIDQPVKKYSSGMYVRLAFAVVANVRADILIIDEALAVGDISFSQKCMRFLRDFKKNGAVIFVSHDTSAVVNLCDRAIWINKGDAMAYGPAKEVCENYLAHRYNSEVSDKRDSAALGVAIDDVESENSKLQADAHDMRMSMINGSSLRNDIKVYDFNESTKSFGNHGAQINRAEIQDSNGRKLSWMVGGEWVRVVVGATLKKQCSQIIFGFNIKDRLGQVILSKNTYGETVGAPLALNAEADVEAVFNIRLPVLRRGMYSVDVAIADGIPPEVEQLHWVHDAFSFESQTSSVMSGLVGLTCGEISVRKKVVT